MAIVWRISALAQRHVEIGGELKVWNGMETPWVYEDTPERAKADYETVRLSSGLIDLSSLKKVHVVGSDAAHVIDRVSTRNVENIAVGRASYASILNVEGKFVDDCIIYHVAVNCWMVVHGMGTAMEQLSMVAAGKNCTVLLDDDLHNIALQGPKAIDILAPDVPGLRSLKFFDCMQTSLYSRNVMISRTGYTGERGYEIFCRAKDAVHLWDEILQRGGGDVRPVQFSTLDMLSVESGLLAYPGDNSESFPFDSETCGDTLWELGLDFTVSPGKVGFIGAENHYALEGKERFRIYGAKLSNGVMTSMETRARVMHNGMEVGVITCGLSSKLNEYSVAIARLDPSVAKSGTNLTIIQSNGTELEATAEELPFYDGGKLFSGGGSDAQTT